MKASGAQRITNALLGGWLFASAFIWPHALVQEANTCVVGALCVAVALSAVKYPKMRRVNSLLALWLLFSAWALYAGNLVTPWHNTLIAFAMFALSVYPVA